MTTEVTVGGEFVADSCSSFLCDKEQEIFPLYIGRSKRDMLCTGADALAAILCEIANEHEAPIELLIPGNYCMEAIDRVRLKLKRLNIKCRYTVVDIIGNLESLRSEIQVRLFLHYNRYDDSILALRNKYPNTIIIEDFVQAPFDMHKMLGHYSFNSLRKVCSLDVSIVYGLKKASLSLAKVAAENNYIQLKTDAREIKSNIMNGITNVPEEVFLTAFSKAEASLLNPNLFLPVESVAKQALHIDWNAIREIRNKNYLFLEEELLDLPQIDILPGHYFFLMIQVPQREELKEFLKGKRIFATVHWAESQSNRIKHILSVPIDQRCGERELQHISHALKEFFESK